MRTTMQKISLPTSSVLTKKTDVIYINRTNLNH